MRPSHYFPLTTHALQHGSGSALALRPAQLATLHGDDVAYAPLAAAPPRARVLRTALLQRFNSLLTSHLALVHTGSARESVESTDLERCAYWVQHAHLSRAVLSLGGRLGALRGLIFFELKHAALKRTLTATTTDADHATVAISRHRATNARERDEPIEAARHSVT